MANRPDFRRPDFRLYHSNSLDILAQLLAQELRSPAPGQSLLAPDIVLIPQVAMRRWLQATLAKTYGIAANLEFLTPGEFVHRALDANVPGGAGDLDADSLQWHLYSALTDPAALRAPALRPLRAYLHAGADALKPWSLAGELAGVFEKYQAWRRDWLLAWEAGHEPGDPQAALWRRVAAGGGHRAQRIGDYLERFADGTGPLPAGLPSRLFAFATLNMSPDVLRVIATQARVGTFHFYLPSPTRSYWGDLQTLAEQLRSGADDPFGTDLDENPMLQAWGAAGRDFMAVLGSYEVVHPSHEHAHYVDPEAAEGDRPEDDTLLGHLQRDLLHRRAPAPWRAVVNRNDPSVQVHACHTRLREVQVLHDQLRGLLDDPRFDPPLQPRDIAVLAPDIDPYIPCIDAVFGGQAGPEDFIPFALADASPLAGEPLAELFLRLLALPVSRFGLNEVLDLLSSPPLANSAGLDAPSLERLHDWLQDAGVRWGLDAAHREQHDAPRDDAYTWAFALDRLLLGYASGSDDDIAGVAPWPELEGSAADALDTLLRLMRVLARHQRTLAEAMPPAQWRERLLGLLDALFLRPPANVAGQRALERLRSMIGDFALSAQRADFDAPVPAEVVRAHFATRLSEADTRAPLLTGGVSFGRMVPMRLLPFRVICVLGLNDGDYPRRDPAAGLNRLSAELGTAHRRHGDRSLREDDRFLFLQLLASAGDVLYLSYQGADPRDGSPREPSVLVSELLNVIADHHPVDANAREALVVRHPLQPFAPAAFGDATDPRRFSYRDEWHPAANLHGGERHALGPWIATPLAAPGADAEVLSLDTLRRFLCDPAGQFLRERMGMRLPTEVELADDTEPMLLPGGGWSRTALQRAVLAALVDRQTEGLYERLLARAQLPSGPLGRREFEAMLGEIRPYARQFAQWRGERAPEAATIDADIDGTLLRGRIDNIYGQAVARVRIGEPNGPSSIRDGLDWLLLCAAGQGRTLVQFHDSGEGAQRHERPPLAAEDAREALRQLLRLRAHGLREALPFAPYSGWELYRALRDGAADDKAWQKMRDRWTGGSSGRKWAEGEGDAIRLTLRGRDLPNDNDLRETFAAITALVFDAVTGHSSTAPAEQGA
ncbi:MAG TPA: exodeoxyribonuclease V subunit gamma [Lysobacter sp.]